MEALRRSTLYQAGEKVTDWIETYTGRQFYPLRPSVQDVHLEDIAHALSMKCRYAGHGAKFYSIAEHSVLLAQAVDKGYVPGIRRDLQRQALLHDAAEAYLADIPRPVKNSIRQWALVESEVEEVICRALGVSLPFSLNIKSLDFRILHNEKKVLFPNSPNVWPTMAPEGPLAGTVVRCWTPARAKRNFLTLARQLGLPYAHS
jgi:hypothetical protein